jgi:hypothetical protein
MKTIYSFIILIFFSGFLFGQKKVDTIEINQFKTVQIIFNDGVDFVEAGTGDLQVKSKIVDNILIIQTVVPKDDFIPTNLFIKTKTNVYNPILKYNETPKKSTFLEKDLDGAVSGNTSLPPTTLSNSNKNSKIEKGVEKKTLSVDNQSLFNRISNRNEMFKPSRQYTTDVWFRFWAHYIENGKYYFKIQLENNSDLDYNIDHFFFSIKSNKKRNASETQREINYVKILNPTEVVPAKTKSFIIFEFDSFSINKNEEFLIEINEKNGARNFTVGVPYFIINKPLTLN